MSNKSIVGTAQITLEELDRLRKIEEGFNELLAGDKCIHISYYFGHAKTREDFYIKATPELNEVRAGLKQQYDEWRADVERIYNSEKRISIFDIGKKIKNVAKKYK